MLYIVQLWNKRSLSVNVKNLNEIYRTYMLFVCILINNSNQKQYSVKRETASCIFCFLPSIHSGEECKNKICFAVGYKRPLRNAISNRRKITFGQRELGRLITCYLSNLTECKQSNPTSKFLFYCNNIVFLQYQQ